MEKISLSQRVYEYMEKYGSISSLEAFRDLGVTRLSACIFILRKLYDIRDEWDEVPNRWGDKVRFKRYYINKEQE